MKRELGCGVKIWKSLSIKAVITALLLLPVILGLSVTKVASAGTVETSIVYSTPLEANVIDPAQGTSIASDGRVIHMIYNLLITYDLGTSEIVPDLAESWEILEDESGKPAIVFHLKEGIRFHDGTPLNAEAVKFSLNRLLEAGLGPAGTLSSIMNTDSTKVIDEYTIEIQLTESSPLTLPFLAVWAGIVSPTYVKGHATEGDPLALEWMASHGCGTGPWKLVEWKRGAQMVFKRNEDYPDNLGTPAPKVDKLIIKVVKDSTVAKMMLEEGDTDIAARLPMDIVEALSETPGIKVVEIPTLKNVFVQINTSHKPLNNVKVRKAINYAINYEEVIETLEGRYARRLYGPLPKGTEWAESPALTKYDYDPIKARELLKEAGYPDGFSTTIIFSNERYPAFGQLSVMIQSYLSDVGIKATVRELAWVTQLDAMFAGEFDLALQTWSAENVDPDDFMWYFYSETAIERGNWNFSFWRNERCTELCDKARVTMDREKRREYYVECQNIGTDNAVYAFLYQKQGAVCMRDDIYGFIYEPLVINTFTRVYR